ncbi:efflux RND transporter periplasmic adaptor subunit [Methylobacterium isbiliense]|uniref:Multidrug resistance protein MdtA n=1 Tax=Methylobacterium isbiliense TaxID=315478 RepID=A0ABQ4SA76_9HYPH|nr:efflux RND transporter periplasmic adaptor subunit [Methylobacterium isbiliense]MDN3622068.1 efflux RND transporter periplasmic adaptor subunit [Methylobacterium isbiliense]GJD99418.1 Multidrug resistance protein MdtA [Methylobacterium isbiliense]
MRRWLTTALALAALGAVGFGLHGRTGPVPTREAASPAPVPVVTGSVAQHDVPLVLTGIGTVQALNTAAIRSQVTGILESVDFTEGQAVRRGDVLARIDPRVFQAQLDQAQAQLARDQALLANQQTNLGRDEPLLQRGFATDERVTGERAQVAQTQSSLKADQAAIDLARTQLDFATLRAPFDGVTGLRLIDPGNIIRPTDATGIVVLTQVQPISVVFTLPAAEIAAVQAALARGPVQAVAYDPSGTRPLDTGTLLLINNQADANTGTVQLKATFPNADRQLWPGTFVNVAVTTQTVRDALTVPADAVQQNDHGPYVFVVGADRTVSLQPVQVAQRQRGTVLIASGLKAGEIVVVQGQYRLTPGTAVVDAPASAVPNTTTASAGMLP